MAAKRRKRGTGHLFKSPSGVYHYQFIDGATGKRKTKSTGKRKLSDAQKEVANFERAATATDQVEVLLHIAKARGMVRSRDLPLSDVWGAFEKTNPTASDGTLRNYRRALNDFTAWLASDYPAVASFTQVEPAIAGEYMEHLWSGGISANTYHYRRNALGHITKKLASAYHIDVNPWPLTERRQEAKQTRRALSAAQAAEFIKTLDGQEPEFRLLGLLCLYTGARLYDAVHLKWSSVDFERGAIQFVPRKTGRTARTALLPLLDPLRQALQEAQRGDSEHVLPELVKMYERNPDGVQKPLVELVQGVTGDGRELNGGTGQRKVQRSAYGAHSLRHTFASQAAMAGAKPAYLAAMLGDNLTTVEKYYVRVGYQETLLAGFGDVPKLIEAKATTDPERAALHKMVDELPLAEVRRLLAQARKQKPKTVC